MAPFFIANHHVTKDVCLTEPLNAITPVILSGGSGTRLWPLSQPHRPKQLLPLTDIETMLQLTARRTHGHPSFRAPIIVGNAAHADAIEAQLAAVGVADPVMVLEPLARNTAPAIALAALVAGPDAVLLVMPSDHVILDTPSFHNAIETALPLVRQGWLVTFGITPDSPDTGYGYLRVGEAVGDGVHKVAQFIEKPDLDRATQMLAAGGHAWNAGIFLFGAQAFIDALAQFQPEMLAAARQSVDRARHEGKRVYPSEAEFATSPSNSVDYAVMEKAEQVACVPVSMGWSDVGSWDSLYAIGEKDGSGLHARGPVTAIDCRNSLVFSDGMKISMVGVDDLIVVASGDEVLILPRGQSQQVRKAAEAAAKRPPADG